VANNVGTGVLADGAGPSIVLVSKTLITGNGLGVSAAGSGSVATYKNNQLNGNVSDGACTAQFNEQRGAPAVGQECGPISRLFHKRWIGLDSA
jgi:hypothetical protein